MTATLNRQMHLDNPLSTQTNRRSIMNTKTLAIRSLSLIISTVLFVSVSRAASIPTGGLELWLSSSQGVSTDGSGFVSSWQDQSGNNRHFTQANTSRQPQLVSGAIGSNPAIRFDGNSDWLTSSVNFNLASGLPFTFIAVTHGTTAPLGLFDSSPGQVNTFRFWSEAADPTHTFELWRSSPRYTGLVLSPMDEWGANMLRIEASLSPGRTVDVYTNGTLHGSLSSASIIQVPFTSSRIGFIANAGAPNFFTGDVAEIIIYSRILSEAELAQVESHLIATYGVPEPSVGLLVGFGYLTTSCFCGRRLRKRNR